MEAAKMGTMLRAHFDMELTRLTESVLEMGSRAHQAVAASVRALLDNDLDLAAEVVAGDIAIDEARHRIEKQCYALLVMEQPVAGDMRNIVAALTIAGELERVGDHGKRIAKMQHRQAIMAESLPMSGIIRMCELALKLVDRSLQAYARHDVDDAKQICKDDDELDALYKQTFNVTLSYMLENTRAIGPGTYLIQVAHELERVGDRATNIAERTIYAQTGELIELNL
jgi:phosphate transport system protein